MPTRGYRFIAEVTDGSAAGSGAATSGERGGEGDVPTSSPRHVDGRAGATERLRQYVPSVTVISLCVLSAIVVGMLIWQSRKSSAGNESLGVRKITQITASVGLDHYPSLSPDGSYVAYSSDQSGSFEIYLRQLAPGGREIQITSDGQQISTRSPDGQYVAYHSMSAAACGRAGPAESRVE